MSTKRTVIDRTKPPGGGAITPEIIEVFKRLLVLERKNKLHKPGGAQSEYVDLCNRLDHVLLDFEPWDYTPSELRNDSVQPEYLRPNEVANWQRAVEVRRQLEQAAASEVID